MSDMRWIAKKVNGKDCFVRQGSLENVATLSFEVGDVVELELESGELVRGVVGFTSEVYSTGTKLLLGLGCWEGEYARLVKFASQPMYYR